MKDEKEDLNDTKYLLEETDFKNNTLDEQYIKNTMLNNTQLLLEDKSSIFYEISNDNLNQNIKSQKNVTININNDNEKERKIEQENSIKDILVKNKISEEKEKLNDEQEIIKQQNILLNNQSSHLGELFSLSYADYPHKKNNIINNNIILNKNKEKLIHINNTNNKQIYFGTIFPSEKIIKNICYKNENQSRIICFKITQNKKQENCEQKEYFKILFDKNKNTNCFNIKSNEEINIKILLEVPFIKRKKELKYYLEIIDINNCLIDKYILYANIEIPKLCCLKYKNELTEYNTPFIQIKISLDNNIINKKFKIPMKNLCLKDLKIKYFLINNPNEENDIKECIDYKIFFENEENLLIPSLDLNYLEFLINIKHKKDFNNINNIIKIKKIIRVNIENTKINYYFYLEILIININNNIANNNI